MSNSQTREEIHAVAIKDDTKFVQADLYTILDMLMGLRFRLERLEEKIDYIEQATRTMRIVPRERFPCHRIP